MYFFPFAVIWLIRPFHYPEYLRFIFTCREPADKMVNNRNYLRKKQAQSIYRFLFIHDLDCPWRPPDLEQRRGRIDRQENNNGKLRKPLGARASRPHLVEKCGQDARVPSKKQGFRRLPNELRKQLPFSDAKRYNCDLMRKTGVFS